MFEAQQKSRTKCDMGLRDKSLILVTQLKPRPTI